MSIDELFGQILKQPRATASAMITRFGRAVRAEDSYYFDYMTKTIYSASHNGQAFSMTTNRRGVLEENQLTADIIGAGASGNIYKSTRYEYAYKKLVIDLFYDTSRGRVPNEWDARELFIEAFIPSTLSVCVSPDGYNYGQHVCRTLGIYRDAATTALGATALRQQAYIDFETSRGHNPRPYADGSPRESVIMYIKMEYAPISMGQHFVNFFSRRPTRAQIIQEVLPRIRELANALYGLGLCYQFNHRDLHVGNVSMAANGLIKIIDFGRCSMVHNGVTYGRDYSRNALLLPCYDLFTFLVSFNERYEAVQASDGSYPIREFIRNGALVSNTMVNLYTICLNKRTGERPAAFHATYPDQLVLWTPLDRYALPVTPCLTPQGLIDRIDSILAGRIRLDGRALAVPARQPRTRWCGTNWCTWKPWGGTRKRSGKKHSKKEKTKRKQ